MIATPQGEKPRRGPWRGAPRLPVLTLFALVAIGLIGGLLLIVATLKAEQRERAQAQQTELIVGLLAGIGRIAVNAETAQRGYFITSDDRYLRPYRAARAQLAPLSDELRRAVSARSPDQLALANEITGLAAAKFAEIEATVVQLGAGDREGAQRRILTDEGQRLMERLRSDIDRLDAIESGRLDTIRASSVANENRIVPLLVSLMGLIVIALALGLSQVLRAARAEASEAQAADLRAARDRADLLAGELNHRVKNLFAVVLAIVRMSGRESPESKPAIEQVAGRIEALLKAHSVTQGSPHHRVARLDELVDTALAPYRTGATTCAAEGPKVELPEAAIVPVGLVLHELATNAVKYGAWSRPGGHIDVHWLCNDQDELHLTWRERGATGVVAPAPGKEGFGSSLVDGAARQIRGRFERRFHDDGMEQHLVFPLTR